MPRLLAWLFLFSHEISKAFFIKKYIAVDNISVLGRFGKITEITRFFSQYFAWQNSGWFYFSASGMLSQVVAKDKRNEKLDGIMELISFVFNMYFKISLKIVFWANFIVSFGTKAHR